MGASIKYGSEELALRDPSGVLAGWQEHYQPIEDTHLFGANPGVESGRWQIGRGATRTNWAKPNYPAAPRLRVNQLYWPTGAARWARGVFLASKEQVTKLLSESSNGSRTLPLVIDDGNGGNITAEMFMLPPRPVDSNTTSADRPWLIPLVDVRYFAQFTSTVMAISQNSNLGKDTWTELLDFAISIEQAADSNYGTSPTVDDVSSIYLQPDFLFGRYQFGARGATVPTIYLDNAPDTNYGVLVDAAAHSTGMRYARDFDGEVKIQRFDSAWTAVQRGLHAFGSRLIAGGELQGVAVPNSVKVYGPAATYTEGIILDLGPADSEGPGIAGRWFEEVSPPSGTTTIPGLTRIIFTSALEENDSAPYESLSDFTLDNITALNALATAIGDDFYASQAHFYDYTFAGVAPWQFTPFDDAALITMDVVDGEYRSTTRVQSMPPNFGCDQMNHQIDVVEIYPDVCPYQGVAGGSGVPVYPSPNATMDSTGSGYKVSVDFSDVRTLVDDNGTSGSQVDAVDGFAAYDRVRGKWVAITADMTLS